MTKPKAERGKKLDKPLNDPPAQSPPGMAEQATSALNSSVESEAEYSSGNTEYEQNDDRSI